MSRVKLLEIRQPSSAQTDRDRFWSWGLFSVAFLLPPDDVLRLDAAIQRLLHSPVPGKVSGGLTGRLAESDLVRYYRHRDRLLAGETIDLLNLV